MTMPSKVVRISTTLPCGQEAAAWVNRQCAELATAFAEASRHARQ